MCTVSYIPLKNGAIFTSNRDEKIDRGIARYPKFFLLNNQKLVFPTDNKAGGTWFISHENGNTGILLNGAFSKHICNPPYNKSRGVILVDIFQSISPLTAMQNYDLKGIENFTILLMEGGHLWELNWDGITLYQKKHDATKPHIWSSVTLYNEKMILERKSWFIDWLKQQTIISQFSILYFHLHTHQYNKEYGLRIFRDNQIVTSSVTSLCIENKLATLYYKDLIRNIESKLDYPLTFVPYISSTLMTESEID
ncbi:MAG: NRDE family protein [Sediminibacterium sp.]|nr:NRDE family protein [Sediminibacterium sp.]